MYWIPQTTADPDTTESEKKNGNNTGSTNTADNSGSGADTPYADDDDPQSPSSPPPLSPTDDAPPGSITVLALKRYSNARAIKGSFSATGEFICTIGLVCQIDSHINNTRSIYAMLQKSPSHYSPSVGTNLLATAFLLYTASFLYDV